MAGPLGTAPGIILGVALGTAAAAAVEPAIELPRQQAWHDNPNRLLNPDLMARLVAQGGITLEAAQASNRREGFSEDKTSALVYLAQTVPGFAEALSLWRRNPGVFDDLWTHALIKAGLDARYMPFLNQLFDDRLDPAIIATAIQRGIMHAPFPLPYNPDVPVGNITPFPTSDLDTAKEAEAHGISVERLRVQTALVGLPMALDRAARARFRNILTEGDYLRAVLEGNARGEWAEAELDVAREILTSGQYTELELRGWYDRTERLKNTAKHGMSEADSDLLFKALGRPMHHHQVFLAERRGGVYNGPTDQIDPHFLKSLQESNERPEWYDLEWAFRFTQPGVFVIRQWLKDGHDPAWAQLKLFYLGWEQDDIDKFIAAYSGGAAGTASKADPWVKRAETQLWTATHKAYIGNAIDRTKAATALTAIGVSPAAQTEIFLLWNEQKAL